MRSILAQSGCPHSRCALEWKRHAVPVDQVQKAARWPCVYMHVRMAVTTAIIPIHAICSSGSYRFACTM